MVVLMWILIGISVPSVLGLLAVYLFDKFDLDSELNPDSILSRAIDFLECSSFLPILALSSSISAFIFAVVVNASASEIARFDSNQYDIDKMATEFIQKCKVDDSYEMEFRSLEGNLYPYIVIYKYDYKEKYAIYFYGLNNAQLSDDFSAIASQYKKEN